MWREQETHADSVTWAVTGQLPADDGEGSVVEMMWEEGRVCWLGSAWTCKENCAWQPAVTRVASQGRRSAECSWPALGMWEGGPGP